MNITQGLFDGMVLQRTQRNVCDVTVAGECRGAGEVVVRAMAGRKTVKGLAGKIVGRAGRGRFEARLTGLVAGGPYTIELAVRGRDGATLDRCTVKNVYVGDVWILAGQSNMQGCGLLADRLPAREKVRAFYMDDCWAPAQDPLHQLWKAVDPVHGGNGVEPTPRAVVGVGPAVAFGQDMLAATGIPQGLIACAHGGTSMAQWDPKNKNLGGKSLYGAMVRRFRKNGSRVAGVLWYQGCSDATPEAAAVYTDRMKELIAAMRRDFGNPNLPIAVVQIARVISPSWFDSASWNSIQDQQCRLQKIIRRVAVVPAIDLDLDDSIHVSGQCQHVLGCRLARAMRVLIDGRRAGRPPILFKSVSMVKDPTNRLMDRLVVEFDNVEGRLVAVGRAMGFTVADNRPAAAIYRTELRGHRAIVFTNMQEADLQQLNLYYGYGVDGYGNIMDEAGRPVPVFGPVPIGKQRAITPFIQEMLISDFLPATAKLDGLEYTPVSSLNLQPRKFPDRLCARNLEIIKTVGQVGVYYYAGRFQCGEAMKLNAVLGYDGPVKAWVDGREIFHDPEGTNPAGTADAFVPFEAGAGEHEILVALGNNQGNAWGICLRFERRDVSRSALQKGPGHYALPAVTAPKND